MINTSISGFDVTGVIDFFKRYDGFSNLNYWQEWNIIPEPTSDGFTKLFIFIYTNYMMRIESNLTVSVMLEFKGKSNALLTIISTGGEKGLFGISYGSEEHCEQKVFDALKKSTQNEWIIKQQ